MAAATLLPPLRPMAAMAGTPYCVQISTKCCLLSTTFTKPTGTAMTSAGRSPASISSAMVSRAVGALPTASTAPGYSRAALCMAATARVVPPVLAAAATPGSAIKQSACPPSLASPGLVMPASAILVSVTRVPPCIACMPAATAPGVKRSVSA